MVVVALQWFSTVNCLPIIKADMFIMKENNSQLLFVLWLDHHCTNMRISHKVMLFLHHAGLVFISRLKINNNAPDRNLSRKNSLERNIIIPDLNRKHDTNGIVRRDTYSFRYQLWH